MSVGRHFFLYTVFSLIAYSTTYENEYGAEYGTKWLYFIYNDTITMMNFSTLPTNGFSFGNAYFYLYTRRNAYDPELLKIRENMSSINSSYFNATNAIKVVTHGWLGSSEDKWIQDIKDAYLRKYNLNFIAVDWSELSKNPIYPWAAFSTRYVGKRISKLLTALTESYKIHEKNIHLVGHSLGAHIMGFAGKFTNFIVDRITGLDPARPLFELPNIGDDHRLQKNDANFVDIIHTSAGVLGYKESHGQADYYPNGGKPAQPGCEGLQNYIEACSHCRSYEFFEESIESTNGFASRFCCSWKMYEDNKCNNNYLSYMGQSAKSDDGGDFYLHTRNESKYSM